MVSEDVSEKNLTSGTTVAFRQRRCGRRHRPDKRGTAGRESDPRPQCLRYGCDPASVLTRVSRDLLARAIVCFEHFVSSKLGKYGGKFYYV